MAKETLSKAKCGKKGFMNMKGNKVFMHIKSDGKNRTYFVNVKTLENILNGTNTKGAYILGFD